MTDFNMIHVIRFIIVVFVTCLLTLFVIDFKTIVDAFDTAINALSWFLQPFKLLVKSFFVF